MKKKILLIVNIDSCIDIITNSSSELFVLTGNTKEIVEGLITNIYPEYKTEYEALKTTEELSNDELDIYISHQYNSWCNSLQRQEYNVLPGFTFEEMYEEGKGWNGKKNFTLRNNSRPGEAWGDFVTNANRDRVINALDPERKKFYLWSIDQNPDWDKQEELMNIGTRYHLG